MSAARIAVTLAAAAVLAAGCGGNDSDEGAPPAATASSAPFDRAFIDAMVPHHRTAIEMVRAARAAGLSEPELVAVADDIVESQGAEIDEMLDWREDWFGSRELDPNAAAALGLSDHDMGMGHDAGELEGAEDVDKAFAAAMIPHHEGAIHMAELALERGEHEEIRALAERIIAAQEREIDVLEPHAGGHHGS